MAGLVRNAALALAAGLVLAGAGCTDYLARRDTMLLESGEAVQANIAVHTVDPAPARAQRFSRDTDGERLQHGIERYRNPQAAAGGFGGPAPLPIGAGAAPLGNPISR